MAGFPWRFSVLRTSARTLRTITEYFFFLFDVRLTLSEKGGLPDTCDTGLLAGPAHTQDASGGTNEVTMWTDGLTSGPRLFLSSQCMDRHAVDDALFRSQKDEIAVIFKNISLENSILERLFQC